MFNISDFSNQMSLPAATLPATCYLQPQPKSIKKSCVVLFLTLLHCLGKKTSCSWISYTDWLRPLMFYLLIIEANRYALRRCSQHPHPPHHASSSPTSSSSFIPKAAALQPIYCRDSAHELQPWGVTNMLRVLWHAHITHVFCHLEQIIILLLRNSKTYPAKGIHQALTDSIV